MKVALALVLVSVGAALFVSGYNRKNSLAGSAAELSSRVARKIDGKDHFPEHTLYMLSGGVLFALGCGLGYSVFRSGSS